MLELVCLLVGLFAGFALSRNLGRRGQASQNPEPGTSDAMRRALAEVEKTDQELAAQLAARPPVAPDSVPLVIDEETQASPEFERMIERIPDPILRQTLTALRGWRPRSRNGDERGYVKSMVAHLAKNGVGAKDIELERRITWSGGRRWAQPDVIVSNHLLIEVKADLGTSSSSDRSLGQMLRYLLAWGKDAPAILIVCGDVEPIMRAVITQYVDAWRTGLRLPVTAWFAREEEIGQVDDKVHTREALVAK